jgi:ABC-type molybdenum transport system ATPase subunit/photorepair protein PhrA
VLDVVCSGFYDSIGLYTMCTAEEIAVAKVGLGKQDMLADACHKYRPYLTASEAEPTWANIEHS